MFCEYGPLGNLRVLYRTACGPYTEQPVDRICVYSALCIWAFRVVYTEQPVDRIFVYNVLCILPPGNLRAVYRTAVYRTLRIQPVSGRIQNRLLAVYGTDCGPYIEQSSDRIWNSLRTVYRTVYGSYLEQPTGRIQNSIRAVYRTAWGRIQNSLQAAHRTASGPYTK